MTKLRSDTNIPTISTSLLTRINEGLVRIEDILQNKKVYGRITNEERSAINKMVSDFVSTGITESDAILSMSEYFKNSRSLMREYTTVGTSGTSGTTANPATAQTTATTQTTSTNQPTTNPATSSNVGTPMSTTIKNKPIDQRGVDAMAQMLKNAGLTQSQLSQIFSKAKV